MERASVIGLVTARGKSKGIPGKNLVELNGKPLIQHSIEAALASEKLDRVVLSTDDEEIAERSKAFGAEVPFMRPEEFAEDGTPDLPVFQHALQELETEEGAVGAFVHLRPTSPFRTGRMIDEAVRQWEVDRPHSVRSMHRVEGKGHPYWMFRKGKGGQAYPFIEGVDLESKAFQRQSLPEAWALNGVVDVIHPDNIRNGGTLWGSDIRIFEILSEEAVDIDSPEDLKLAEFLMQQKRGR